MADEIQIHRIGGGGRMNDPRMEMESNFLKCARAGNLEKMLELLDNGLVDLDTSNQNGLNALHLACKEGHVNIVNELLARHMNVDKPTKKGNTAMHIASMAGHENIIRVLVQYGANVNAQSQNGFTPLYMAAQENNEAVVRYLLSHGASQSIATEDGFTPLSVALQQGHNNVVKLLMENDPKGKVKLPALHAVAKKDDLQAATLLIQKEPLKDGLPAVNETTKSGFTPLHIAAHYGSARVAKLLLQNGADVNFKAKNAITPLHVACKWGKGELVELLLDYDADIECKTRDSLTPIHCACRSGHLGVVNILVSRGSPVSTKTKSGLVPLHMAAQGDHVDCAEFLLAKGANIDEVTVDSLTPLHVAAHCGNVRMAKFLLDDKCDVNARALNGFTPLHVACKKNKIKIIELLLKYGAHIEATTESGLTPLHVSSFMGYNSVVIYLLERGSNTEMKTFRGETALHLASRANQIEIMELLLKNGADVNAQAKEGQSALHVSSRLGSLEAVDLLLNHGATRDQTTKDLYTPLHIAVKEGHEHLVKMLLKKGADRNITTKKGFTPLHLVARSGNVEISKLLVQEGANPDVVGKNGLTPLHVATHYNSVDVAALLMEKKASPHSAAKNGYTPLHIAAKRNQVEIAKLLLKNGAKVNSESKNGYTPLHLATQEGHTDVVTLILTHRGDVACRSKNGLTPMHLAAQEDKVEVAQILVDHKSPIDPQTKAGYTPLHTACHFGQLNMVKFLLERDASVRMSTSAGHTPLHQAAQQGHVLVIRILLKHGADPDALTSTGQTPLSIAQHVGFISAVEALRPSTKHVAQQLDEYKRLAPETMQELALDSDDENGDKTLLADKSYQYLTVDDTKDMRYNTSYPDDKGDIYDARSGGQSVSSIRGRDSFRDSVTPQSTLERKRPDSLKVTPLDTINKQPPHEEDMLYIWSNNNRSQNFKEDFPNFVSTPLSREVKFMGDEEIRQNGLHPDQLDHLKSHHLNSDHQIRGDFQNFSGKMSGLSPKVNMASHGGSMYSDVSNTSTFMADNISMDRQPICSGFLVSFMVDARGGAMSGCRHSGVRVVVPPCKVCQPTRITCKMLRADKMACPIPHNDGESFATRVLQMGPAGIKFTGSVLIELPHFASLRGQERELMIMRSDDGKSWHEHGPSSTEEQVHATMGSYFAEEDFESAEKLYDRQIVRIVTSDFPRYFCVVTRYRHESKVVGSEGAILSSKVVPQVQVVFPKNAIQSKNIRVSLQVMPSDSQLVHSICGEGVTASPVVTIEPRHRKFHEPITITIPLPPQSSLKGNKPDVKLTNKLRLLYSMEGGSSPAKWEDITGSSPLTLTNDCITFYTNVSARFWLIEGMNLTSETSPKLTSDLYGELIRVPFLTKFVVFSKRKCLTEANLRVFCTTDDDNDDKTLEIRQKFCEIAKGRDVEVFEGAPQNLDLIGNLLLAQSRPRDSSSSTRTANHDQSRSIIFRPFRENRFQVTAKLKDIKADPVGQLLIIPSEPRLVRARDGRCVNPMCALNIFLPRDIQPDPTPEEQDLRLSEVLRNAAEVAEERVAKAEMRLTDIADKLQSDWVLLARQLHFTQQEIVDIQKEYTYVGEQALVVLHIWLEKNKGSATGNELERALARINRKDIIDKCMGNMQEVTDDNEKKEALAQLREGSHKEGNIMKNGMGNVTKCNSDQMRMSNDVPEQEIIDQFMKGSS